MTTQPISDALALRGPRLARLAFAIAIVIGSTAVLLPQASGLAQASGSYKVIVNNANPVDSISTRDLSRMFLRKLTRWSGELVVNPVDLNPDSTVREQFSTDVLGKPVFAVKAYWNRQIFSGAALPPPEKGNDAEVLTYVQANPGAIGYVSATAEVTNVKVIRID